MVDRVAVRSASDPVDATRVLVVVGLEPPEKVYDPRQASTYAWDKSTNAESTVRVIFLKN